MHYDTNKGCMYGARLHKVVPLRFGCVRNIPLVKLFWVNHETKVVICECN